MIHKKMLSGDWGTSSLRLRLVDVTTGECINKSVSDEGILTVYDAWIKTGADESGRMAFYLAVINRHIKELAQKEPGMELELPVILSGMASSTIGITALSYTRIPFLASATEIKVKHWAKRDFFRHQLILISGACTDTDVMRGEETQLIGCTDAQQKGLQLIIFPGTHSKHIVVENGTVTGLTTYMTGELFRLLSTQSILATSILSSGGVAEENERAFAQAVKEGVEQSLSQVLFRVRTNQLLHHFSKEANYHFLSGLLIGSEINALVKVAITNIILVGEEQLVASYLRAFAILGINSTIKIVDAATATIQGQLAVYRQLYA